MAEAVEGCRFPVELADLPGRLSRELDPGRPRRLTVLTVTPAGPSGLCLLIGLAAGVDRQSWEVSFEVSEADLELLDADSFVLTIRANLEEWWDTRTPHYDSLPARRLA